MSEQIASNAKAWVAAIGGSLATVIPAVLMISESLPPQWSAVITAVIALLTTLGVYKAPYRPTGTVLVPDSPAVREAVYLDESSYENPWK